MRISLAAGRVTGLLCVVAVTALGLSACGSGGSSSSPASGSSRAATGLAALLPARIAQSGMLVVGIENAGSSAMDSTSGSAVVGFDPDLIKAIGTELGVTVKIEPTAFDSLVAGVQSGRYDVSIGAMGDTKSREQSVSFVDYLNIGLAIVVKKGNSAHIHGASDLCGKAVAVLTGAYPQEVMVPKLSAECTKDGKAAIHASTFADLNSAVLAVQSGRADCLYDDSSTAGYLLKTAGGQFEQVGSSQTIARTGIAFAKDDNKLGSAIEAAVLALMKAGQYSAIAKRWDLTGEMIPKPSINDALI